jgi:hypothetical protein
MDFWLGISGKSCKITEITEIDFAAGLGGAEI